MRAIKNYFMDIYEMDIDQLMDLVGEGDPEEILG